MANFIELTEQELKETNGGVVHIILGYAALFVASMAVGIELYNSKV